jgi:hypothetical protein
MVRDVLTMPWPARQRVGRAVISAMASRLGTGAARSTSKNEVEARSPRPAHRQLGAHRLDSASVAARSASGPHKIRSAVRSARPC